MRIRWLVPALLLVSFPASAQHPLSTSPRKSTFVHAYRLTDAQAGYLFKTDLYNWDKIALPPPTDSFLSTREDDPRLPPGNYLFIKAVESNLQVSLQTIGLLRHHLLHSGDRAALVLHTSSGNPVTDAAVFVRRHAIRYDTLAACYPLGRWARSRIVKVEHEGAVYFFPVDHVSPVGHSRWWQLWHPQYYHYRPAASRRFESRFRSFFALSKPKYKPGDTVSGKAFIMDRKGHPIDHPLALRLSSQRSSGTDTILTRVTPYRPGGYSFAFVLTDSLRLSLDDTYDLTLEQVKKKSLSRSRFTYEEYDLTSIRLNARTDREEHYLGEPLSVYLQALDENDLPVPDARIEIDVLSSNAVAFHDPTVFLKDTLWHWTQTLDPVGETRILLPDSIFPSASFPYTVDCRLLNSDNETDRKQLDVRYYTDTAHIDIHAHTDSLDIRYTIRGRPAAAQATVTAFTAKEEIIASIPLSLPASLRVNPLATLYGVSVGAPGDSLRADFDLSTEHLDIPAFTKRTRDTVLISVNNPARLPFWYTITAGRKVILRGYGDQLHYLGKPVGSAPYHLQLQYLWQGDLQSRQIDLPFFEKRLTIDIRQPEYVYPGEKVNIAIAVTDAAGRPVADADLTAYAITAKFKEQSWPHVPYFGKRWRNFVPGGYTLPAVDQQNQLSLPLDWSKWSKPFGLDTLEYYKFLHPATIYTQREKMPDGLTQVAPFVSRKGQPEPVHMLYIDEELVYFDGAEQQRRYSFSARPGWHTLRLRLTDKAIRIDSFRLEEGMKTIIGINDDTANQAINIWPMPDTLISWEKESLQHSLILLRNTFSPNFATIGQGNDRLYLLAPSGAARRTWLTGPLTGADAFLQVEDRFKQYFEPEGGYEFIISPGLIKEKQSPYPYPFATRLSPEGGLPGLGDRVLTPAIADSLWQDWLDDRSATQDLFLNEYAAVSSSGRLQIGVPAANDGKKLFVKKVFVFRYDDADYLRVFKGEARQLGSYEPGVYRVMLLLKGNRYLLHDSVVVRADGKNYYGFDRIPIKEADTFSIRLSGMLRRLEDQWVDPHSAGMDSMHFVFNHRYMNVAAFDQEVSGIVTDDKGSPIYGVSVQLKGTSQATATDDKGWFHLRTPSRGTLVFSYVGYERIERPFLHPDHYEIKLHPVTNALNEVVVVGYAVQRKRSLTYSVSTVLEGNVAGLQVFGSRAADADALDKLYGFQPAIVKIPPMPGLDTVRTVRRHFRDDAFWQPRLRTDEKGLASFTVTYPDDITSWNEFVLAADDHRRTGFAAAAVRSLKPLSARLSNPTFLVAGDSAFVIGKLMNYGADTVTVDRRFSIDDQPVADRKVNLRNARIDTFLVHPSPTRGRSTQPDSIRLSYTLQRTDGYFDGEERSIPVLPAGVKETRGHFVPLEGDTSLRLSFDTTLGTVHVFAEASLMPVMLDEIEHIRQYEYLCNEQLASKLMALLQKKRICLLQQLEFKEEKNINQLIEKLMQGRRGKALWGWWVEGDGLPWISLHVTEALLAAEKAGYTTGLDKQSLISFLVYNFESGTMFDRLLEVRMLQELQAKVDYQRYADTIARHLDRRSLYQTLRLEEVRQAAGLPTGLDTLVGRCRYTALGNCYWGEDNRVLFDNSIQITLLMYRLLRQAGGYTNILRKTRNWLLEKRGTGYWRNTYESSLILETLLPDLLTDGRPPQAPVLILNGQRVTAFPYHTLLPADAGVDVSKSGSLPVYFTAWQQFQNYAPEKVEGTFVVRTWFEQGGTTVERLKAGEPAVLTVEVQAKGDAGYVLVEAPIPAGCTYAEKSQWFGNQELHSEYFKNKLSIFCQAMSKGTHVFHIRLRPRWTGIYRLNPARAELLYFPVLFGREEMKRTVID
ncbi:carboxypeptidase-like regulatory domain-containing protein [Puia dinghuensis]|uniref:Alpha-2-macroglobulin domain-containing protein n=1 Tax=Puia dinghuensis TaxID=1792502 RepID=A0A8J2U887_9BACT|nr:alpha-2-macroglobulin family protein [Puia dinghuensis]GGA85574.1 hypothetical protein GCM10011511_05730 [Puia dinghuensis]